MKKTILAVAAVAAMLSSAAEFEKIALMDSLDMSNW